MPLGFPTTRGLDKKEILFRVCARQHETRNSLETGESRVQEIENIYYSLDVYEHAWWVGRSTYVYTR